MSDRELLEAAARAAGMKVRIYPGMSVERGTDCVCVDERGFKWNPLTDDGDALRLAVALKMDVWIGIDGTTADGVDCEEAECSGDPYAATRRAIVLAAAAMAASEQ